MMMVMPNGMQPPQMMQGQGQPTQAMYMPMGGAPMPPGAAASPPDYGQVFIAFYDSGFRVSYFTASCEPVAICPSVRTSLAPRKLSARYDSFPSPGFRFSLQYPFQFAMMQNAGFYSNSLGSVYPPAHTTPIPQQAPPMSMAQGTPTASAAAAMAGGPGMHPGQTQPQRAQTSESVHRPIRPL